MQQKIICKKSNVYTALVILAKNKSFDATLVD